MSSVLLITFRDLLLAAAKGLALSLRFQNSRGSNSILTPWLTVARSRSFEVRLEEAAVRTA